MVLQLREKKHSLDLPGLGTCECPPRVRDSEFVVWCDVCCEHHTCFPIRQNFATKKVPLNEPNELGIAHQNFTSRTVRGTTSRNGSKAKLKIAIKKEQKWPWVWVSMGILVSFLSNEWWTAPADLVPMVAASLRPALDVLDALDALGRTGLRWCNHGFVENRKVVILHVI